ncbi:hypothetical protein MLD38_001373 [Melastoma candidum]|uniref:Uncharacterized protein n=1 Tax=Melastoma candidum TaxID=119954 RepID=A0ACB9SF05_9MYRT|nr:hypothetical protein MLD38_001373 [Melastoma candidum]
MKIEEEVKKDPPCKDDEREGTSPCNALEGRSQPRPADLCCFLSLGGLFKAFLNCMGMNSGPDMVMPLPRGDEEKSPAIQGSDDPPRSSGSDPPSTIISADDPPTAAANIPRRPAIGTGTGPQIN